MNTKQLHDIYKDFKAGNKDGLVERANNAVGTDSIFMVDVVKLNKKETLIGVTEHGLIVLLEVKVGKKE